MPIRVGGVIIVLSVFAARDGAVGFAAAAGMIVTATMFVDADTVSAGARSIATDTLAYLQAPGTKACM